MGKKWELRRELYSDIEELNYKTFLKSYKNESWEALPEGILLSKVLYQI